MDDSAVEGIDNEESEPGAWRTAHEFAQLMSDTSKDAGVITKFGFLGFTARSIYQMSFLYPRLERRTREGTFTPEYPTHVQLDAAERAIEYFARSQAPAVRDKWLELANERIGS